MANNFASNIMCSAATGNALTLNSGNIRNLHTKEVRINDPTTAYKHALCMVTLTYDGTKITDVYYQSTGVFAVNVTRAGTGIYDFWIPYNLSTKPFYVMPMATLLDDGGWNKRCISAQVTDHGNQWQVRIILTDTGNNKRCDGWITLTLTVTYGTK